MLGLVQGELGLIVLISRYQLLVVEVLLALEVGLCLLQVDVGQTYAHLGRAELIHVRNDLHLGNDVASIHVVAWLLVELRDDT